MMPLLLEGLAAPESHSNTGIGLAMVAALAVVRFMEHGGGWLIEKLWRGRVRHGANGVKEDGISCPLAIQIDPATHELLRETVGLMRETRDDQRESLQVMREILHSQERLADRFEYSQERLIDRLEDVKERVSHLTTAKD